MNRRIVTTQTFLTERDTLGRARTLTPDELGAAASYTGKVVIQRTGYKPSELDDRRR